MNRALPALAALALLALAGASTAAARPLPYPHPLTGHRVPSTTTAVRCVVLETYPRGTLNGCTDGRVTFTPRNAR